MVEFVGTLLGFLVGCLIGFGLFTHTIDLGVGKTA